MSDPRYAPRDCAVDYALFGKSDNLTWKSLEAVMAMYPNLADTETRAQALLLAAKLQHLYVLRIRQRLQVRRTPVKSFAADAGIGYDRMVKVLRGAAILRFEDLAMADVLIGEVSEFAVRDARQADIVIAKAELDATQRARDSEFALRTAMRETLAKAASDGAKNIGNR
ncbi:hypothetical protein [Frigoribacterium sp. UYMn621]|uniref:hypothetical protein n=1 Tax=Frigoribacterium sp. UYMn621 TaxID=3156343 RepID=UPI003393D069